MIQIKWNGKYALIVKHQIMKLDLKDNTVGIVGSMLILSKNTNHQNNIPPICFVDKSHGQMYFITANDRRNDKWECFVCGSYTDSHGAVKKDTKFCDSFIGGIISNA